MKWTEFLALALGITACASPPATSPDGTPADVQPGVDTPLQPTDVSIDQHSDALSLDAPDASVDAVVDAATDGSSAPPDVPPGSDVVVDSTPATDVGDADADAGAIGVSDGGTLDAVDAAIADTADAGPSVPCTSAGQQDCVPCNGNGNDGGTCTPTEALLVEYDLGNGQDPNDPHSCFGCLYAHGCLDDNEGDTGEECQDLPPTTFTAGNGNVGQYSALCLATLTCILDTGCAANGVPSTNCYCGPAGGGPTSCAANGPLTNGVCKIAETDGLLAMPDDATNVERQWTTMTLPSGLVNAIFACGVAGHCAQCPY